MIKQSIIIILGSSVCLGVTGVGFWVTTAWSMSWVMDTQLAADQQVN